MRFPVAAAAAAVVLATTGCSQVAGLSPRPPIAGTPAPEPISSSGTPRQVTTAPTPTPEPTPVPSPTPAVLRADFEQEAPGSVPADWVDVTGEGNLPAWVYAGKWGVAADERGNQVLLHDDVREQPAVSFLRYRGGALGRPNGEVPPRYYAEVAMRPIRSPINYPPTGDQGVQFYYVSHNVYLEVVVKPDQLEVWECKGGEPKTTKGWKKLWGEALSTKAGDVRQVGALVDVPAGTFTAYLDGKAKTPVKSEILVARPAWVALRGIGNVVSFDNLLVEPR